MLHADRAREIANEAAVDWFGCYGKVGSDTLNHLTTIIADAIHKAELEDATTNPPKELPDSVGYWWEERQEGLLWVSHSSRFENCLTYGVNPAIPVYKGRWVKVERPKNLPCTCVCSFCGYEWAHGRHGSHDCGKVLKDLLASMFGPNAEAAREKALRILGKV
jgi:hypothetical protein